MGETSHLLISIFFFFCVLFADMRSETLDNNKSRTPESQVIQIATGVAPIIPVIRADVFGIKWGVIDNEGC